MSDITINYKGSSIATMDASGTKTLLTEGKYCEDDIDVVYQKPSGGGADIIFGVKNFVVPSTKFVMTSCIPNPLNDGGCIHCIFVLQTNSNTSSDRQVFSFGIGALSAWSPGSTNVAAYLQVLKSSNTARWYFRGAANKQITLSNYVDANNEAEIKLYKTKWVDVKTSTDHTYDSDMQTFFNTLSNATNISVGNNQGTVFSDATLKYFAIEGA